MRNSFLLVAMIAGLANGTFGVCAYGATLSYTASVAQATTDWNTNVSITQFNPALGTLNSVKFEVTGTVSASNGYENTSTNSGTSVNYSYSSVITLFRPDNSTIAGVTYSASGTQSLGVFDGTVDFGGTSGYTYYHNSSTTATHTSPPPAADLTLFTGTSSVTLPVSADATYSDNAGGNVSTSVSSEASATIKVTYDYEAIPEPSSLASFFSVAACCGSVAAWRRRKAARAAKS